MMYPLKDDKVDITIGMPVFNDRKFLNAALDTILSQSYPNFILILSDDNSTDGSQEICKYYSAIDSRIIYYRHEKNIGISRNMKFLLNKGATEFFMWAGNDDMWDKDFLLTLKEKLVNNPKAIVAFCPYLQIDEANNIIGEGKSLIEDFEGETSFQRLMKLVKRKSDGFGYGLFRRELIRDVQFPVWWWPNYKCAYNNIYPSLVYYLAKGEYVFFKDKVLWYNRIKSNQNINHKIPFSNNFFLAFLAFSIRKFNLFIYSITLLKKASKSNSLVFKVGSYLFWYWFFIPVFYNCHKKYFEFKKRGAEIFI